MTNQVLRATIRNYDADGAFLYVSNFNLPVAMVNMAEAGFNAVMGQFPNVNPCNCSVRGPGGRFVKWRNRATD